MRINAGGKQVVINMKLQRCKLILIGYILLLSPLRMEAETIFYDLGSPRNNVRTPSNGNPINLPAGTQVGTIPIGGGNTIRSGSGAPSNGLGIDGDFYIDTAVTPRNLYGPKASGVWPTAVSMGGPAGPTGPGVPNGGLTGQVLRKNSNTDQDTGWLTITGTGTVTNVTVSSPLNVTNGTTTPALSISLATNVTSGYLSAADWIIFNGKLSPSGNASGLTGIVFSQIGGVAASNQIPDSVINSSWQSITQSGGTLTLTCDTKKPIQKQTVTLTANVTTFTISSVFNGATGELIVKQDSTGSRTLVLPPNSKVINGGGGVVTLTTTANAIDYLAWSYDGTNYYWTYGKNFN